MLVALFTYLLLGGGDSFGAMPYIELARANLNATITDDEQRAATEEILLAIETRAAAQADDVASLSANLQGQFGSRDLDAAAIDALWEEYFETNADYADDMLDLRFQLRDEVSREQWSNLFGIKHAE
ncbi:MAG: hypothetical protein AAFZ58_08545 [Pseudomonadota bacterium]